MKHCTWNFWKADMMKWSDFWVINEWVIIHAEQQERNDDPKKSKNWNKESLKTQWKKFKSNKSVNCKFHLKTWWNEKKQSFNCCCCKSENMWKKVNLMKNEKSKKTLMLWMQKKSCVCSRQNCENRIQFEQITIWMQVKLNDWVKKNQKHLIFCSILKSKKSNNQLKTLIDENRFRAEMKITPYWQFII